VSDIWTDIKSFFTNLEPDFVKYEPVIVAWAVNGGLAVLLGNVVGISHTQEAAVTTIATGLVAIYTAIKTDNFTVSGFTGVVTTIAVAAAAFGLHLSSQEIGAGAAVLSGVLGLILRQNVSPAATVSSS
jgi:hypothetical protein